MEDLTHLCVWERDSEEDKISPWPWLQLTACVEIEEEDQLCFILSHLKKSLLFYFYSSTFMCLSLLYRTPNRTDGFLWIHWYVNWTYWWFTDKACHQCHLVQSKRSKIMLWIRLVFQYNYLNILKTRLGMPEKSCVVRVCLCCLLFFFLFWQIIVF